MGITNPKQKFSAAESIFMLMTFSNPTENDVDAEVHGSDPDNIDLGRGGVNITIRGKAKRCANLLTTIYVIAWLGQVELYPFSFTLVPVATQQIRSHSPALVSITPTLEHGKILMVKIMPGKLRLFQKI